MQSPLRKVEKIALTKCKHEEAPWHVQGEISLYCKQNVYVLTLEENYKYLSLLSDRTDHRIQILSHSLPATSAGQKSLLIQNKTK